ncbi:hypothetical protein NUU61_005712 [Penicillium alfredii]|uniref:Quinate repressor protein n=1 Tax=Penicillium alfredii TaxID=1506179 RepID=A0A9W9FA42_9EURO|nr:uncharacterized protein NUU61_005712 [Penicillium alfredii]KAJ5096356.1 hypothetical protein NUU61_005712 [Penicillium alfredii]
MFTVCAPTTDMERSRSPPLNTSLVVCRQYDPDATLLLVGFFGAGKKTLGIIASIALRRRLVDFEASFRQEFQTSPQDYIALHGLQQYREVELRLSQDLLARNEKGCVIVGLGWIASHQQQLLLQDFARQHPVVYVRREDEELRQFVTSTPDKFERIFAMGNTFFESCSNFEFFNHTGQITQSRPRLPAYLKLKETERVFVEFLHRVFRLVHRQRRSADIMSAQHTYALQISPDQLNFGLDLEELESGADAIDLQMELGDISPRQLPGKMARYMATLRMHTRASIIVDLKPSTQSNMSTYSELLWMLLRLAPDFITCSLTCDAEFIQRLNAAKGHTRTIATHHQLTPLAGGPVSSDLLALHKQAQKLGFEALRMTGESRSLCDNLPCLALLQEMSGSSSIPIIAYNTGTFGRTSVCLNRTLSPVVLPQVKPTGVTLKEAQQALTSCFLIPAKTFTIFGQTTGYSLSPKMHNAAYTACGLPHLYDTLESQHVSDVRRLLNHEGHGGVTISLPYKTDILPYLDEISSDARDMNAVNTVVLDHVYDAAGERKTICRGYNTDYIGIRDCIHKHLSPANAIRDGTTALIIGAGGMANAAIYACYQLGIRKICIYNRTPDHAEKVADYFRRWAGSNPEESLHINILRSTKDPWPANLRLPTVAVSCIPSQEIGSQAPVTLQVSDEWLGSKTGGVFVEVAYGPSKTPLMEQVLRWASKGWIVVDGLTVLVEQGITQYELFTKRPAPIHVMRRVVLEQSMEYGISHF